MSGKVAVLPFPEYVIWIFFGLLLPICVATCWRWAQKTIFKGIALVFGETYNRIRGAARGDTISYLTGHSGPIYSWFEDAKKGSGSSEAKNAGFVCFGHTHIPDGPMKGTDEKLKDITFLNTGSWMHPISAKKQKWANASRSYTKWYDRWDQWVVIAYVVASLLALALAHGSVLFWVAICGAILFVVESFVAIGKSSYRRLAEYRVRSLAFIGKDASGIRREVLLYWDPQTNKLLM
jgi:hypothetical protein